MGNRLDTVCGMVPHCEKIWDVGTDHALIPIYCVQSGKCSSALASDIREKPLKIARKNILLYGCENNIEILQCAGLEGRDAGDFGAVIIAGMGGYTVCSILSGKLKTCGAFPENTCLILQPNTAENEVRRFLWQSGFRITDEQAVRDGAHVYVTLKCVYTGLSEDCTETECFTGKIMPERLSENDSVYFRSLAVKYSNILRGLEACKMTDIEKEKRKKMCTDLLSELGRRMGIQK